MLRPFVFFDLDGTLTDPAPGICGCVRYALEKGGYQAEPLEAYHSWIGPPLLSSFEEYLHCNRAESERLVALYRERFGTVGLFENTLYPAIPGLLAKLKAAGARMALCTGKPTVYAARILEHFGIAEYFDYFSGIELQGEPLSKHGVIRLAMEKLGVSDPGKCIMVGDRFHDVEGAQLSHMESVMVLYGYGDAAEAERCGATYTAGSVEELEALLLG